MNPVLLQSKWTIAEGTNSGKSVAIFSVRNKIKQTANRAIQMEIHTREVSSFQLQSPKAMNTYGAMAGLLTYSCLSGLPIPVISRNSG
jgi:hypothetical protein